MRSSTLMPLPLRTCFALFVAAVSWAQQSPRPTPPQKGDGPLTRASFTAKGLNSEEDLTDLFAGNFSAVTFDRGGLAFSMLFQSCLEAFSSRCFANLPANKVEMTIQVCAEDQTKWMTVNSRGNATWNPSAPFRGVVTATDGGSCAVGHHEILALTP